MLLGLIGIGIWGIAACEYRAIPPVVPSPSLPAQGGVRTPELGKSPLPPPSPTREALTVFPGFGLEQVIGKGILREIAWSSRGSPLIVGTTVSLEGIAPQTGAVIWRQTLPARLKALAISPDGHWLAALVGGDLWLWAHLEENPQRIRVLPRTIDPGFESPPWPSHRTAASWPGFPRNLKCAGSASPKVKSSSRSPHMRPDGSPSLRMGRH